LQCSTKEFMASGLIYLSLSVTATNEASRKEGGIYDVRTVLATGKRQR
jgi:hypothetical protein